MISNWKNRTFFSFTSSVFLITSCGRLRTHLWPNFTPAAAVPAKATRDPDAILRQNWWIHWIRGKKTRNPCKETSTLGIRNRVVFIVESNLLIKCCNQYETISWTQADDFVFCKVVKFRIGCAASTRSIVFVAEFAHVFVQTRTLTHVSRDYYWTKYDQFVHITHCPNV